jgi:hypothetical protein
MQIACKCEKCGHMFMNSDDDLCIQLDFLEKKLSFMCRNKKCRHDNIFDFGGWQKQQKHSPLPTIRIM